MTTAPQPPTPIIFHELHLNDLFLKHMVGLCFFACFLFGILGFISWLVVFVCGFEGWFICCVVLVLWIKARDSWILGNASIH